MTRLGTGIQARRRWRPSLRLRLTVAGTFLGAVAFAICGTVVLAIYHNTLVDDENSSVLATARAIAARVDSVLAADPIPMPVAPGVPRIQILDAQGHVLTGDPASVGDPPMLTLAPGQNERFATVERPPGLPDHRAAVVAVRASPPWSDLTVVAAASLDPADAKAAEATDVTVAVGAASLAAVAAIAWLTVRHSLRPVDRMRARVATITSGSDLKQRVSVTGGADELARLGSTLNEMLAKLENADARQRAFIADAAHELRTPLAGITAALEVAHAHPDAYGERQLVEELLGAHRKLGSLVNDLLTLATIDAHVPTRHGPVDLAGVVTDCCRRSVPEGMLLTLDPVTKAMVTGNAGQLGRVVTNLLDNALRYARCRVQVGLTTCDGDAVLAVVDDGPGIPPGDRARVWERFVRLDDDRGRSTGGTGLGLALVREIVHAHGGSSDVGEADEGEGAAVIVRLPLAPTDDGTDGMDGTDPAAVVAWCERPA